MKSNPGFSSATVKLWHSCHLPPVFGLRTQHRSVHLTCNSYNSWVRALLPVHADHPWLKKSSADASSSRVSQFPSSCRHNCLCCSAYAILMLEKHQDELHLGSLLQLLTKDAQHRTAKLHLSQALLQRSPRILPWAAVPPLAKHEPAVEQLLGRLRVTRLCPRPAPGTAALPIGLVTQSKHCISGLLPMLAAGHPRRWYKLITLQVTSGRNTAV